MPNININIPTVDITNATSAGVYILTTINFNNKLIPKVHVEDAQKLEADAYISLFEIILYTGSVLYLTLNKTKTWQGKTYEGTGIQIDGIGSYSDSEVSRPKLGLFNPLGVYSSLVEQGYLEGAKVIRYRLLKEHLESDIPVYRKEEWKVSRVSSLKVGLIGLELRNVIDGQIHKFPGRQYIPPYFPTVRLR